MNLYSVVSLPAGVILNTVPLPVPPPGVVLYKLPSRPCAMIPGELGSAGSPARLPKLYSTENWALAAVASGSSKAKVNTPNILLFFVGILIGELSPRSGWAVKVKDIAQPAPEESSCSTDTGWPGALEPASFGDPLLDIGVPLLPYPAAVKLCKCCRSKPNKTAFRRPKVKRLAIMLLLAALLAGSGLSAQTVANDLFWVGPGSNVTSPAWFRLSYSGYSGGADWCKTLNNALTTVPGGSTVIGDIGGVVKCDSDPFAGVSSGFTLYQTVPIAIFLTANGTWAHQPEKSHIYGLGESAPTETALLGSSIVACAAVNSPSSSICPSVFPRDNVMHAFISPDKNAVYTGSGGSTVLWGWTINCNYVQGAIGHRNYESQENAGLYSAVIRNCGNNGIAIDIGNATPTSQGTVNISGNTVTWVSGTPFSTTWGTGDTMTINGSTVVNLVSCSNTTPMTCTTSGSGHTGSGVSYTFSPRSGGTGHSTNSFYSNINVGDSTAGPGGTVNCTPGSVLIRLNGANASSPLPKSFSNVTASGFGCTSPNYPNDHIQVNGEGTEILGKVHVEYYQRYGINFGVSTQLGSVSCTSATPSVCTINSGDLASNLWLASSPIIINGNTYSLNGTTPVTPVYGGATVAQQFTLSGSTGATLTNVPYSYDLAQGASGIRVGAIDDCCHTVGTPAILHIAAGSDSLILDNACSLSPNPLSTMLRDDNNSSLPIQKGTSGCVTEYITDVNGKVISDSTGTVPAYQGGGTQPTSIKTQQLARPSIASVTTFGVSGSTSYKYRVVARDQNGVGSDASNEFIITTGNSVLSASNYNIITINPQPGAASFDVRRESCGGGCGLMLTGYIGSVPTSGNSLVLNDQGQTADGTPIPTTNTTGEISIVPNSFLMTGGNNSLAVTGSNWTTTSTTFVTITGLSKVLPYVVANVTFRCDLIFSGSNTQTVAFGVQTATNAPSSLSADGRLDTSHTTFTDSSTPPVGVQSTAAQSLFSVTPTNTDLYTASIFGTVEGTSRSGTMLNIVADTTSGTLTVYRGSQCWLAQ